MKTVGLASPGAARVCSSIRVSGVAGPSSRMGRVAALGVRPGRDRSDFVEELPNAPEVAPSADLRRVVVPGAPDRLERLGRPNFGLITHCEPKF